MHDIIKRRRQGYVRHTRLTVTNAQWYIANAQCNNEGACVCLTKLHCVLHGAVYVCSRQNAQSQEGLVSRCAPLERFAFGKAPRGPRSRPGNVWQRRPRGRSGMIDDRSRLAISNGLPRGPMRCQTSKLRRAYARGSKFGQDASLTRM